MIERQQYKCSGSGVPLEPHTASLDHMTPRSKGGANTLDNLHIVHHVVNRAKGEMNWPDFVAMCHSIARTHEDTCVEWWGQQVAVAAAE